MKKSTIPYGKQYINNQDIKSVSRSLRDEFITTGSSVKNFETDIRKKVRSKYAYTCINGTAGLHLAYLSIDLKKNDVVIMPAINFVSAYRIAQLLGAKIYLADVDPFSGQMTPQTVLDCIKKNKLKKIKVILTMYLGGYVLDNLEFYKIKKKYRSYLIEDACHAFGAKYKFNNKYNYIGSCMHSDLCIFSFHPIKPITTGEGGAITTNSKSLADKIKLLRSHGIVRKKNYWDYDISTLGFNYRLSDINCALGISQLKKLQDFYLKRKKIFQLYKKSFSRKISDYAKILDISKNINSFHLILLSINFVKLKCSKNEIFKFLNKRNIFPQFHYKPIYEFSFYKKEKKNKFPGAGTYYNSSISLPVYYSLTKKSQNYVIKNIINFININKKKSQ